MSSKQPACLEQTARLVTKCHPSPCVPLQACRALRFSGTAVPREYELRFQLAVWAFRHQRCVRHTPGNAKRASRHNMEAPVQRLLL